MTQLFFDGSDRVVVPNLDTTSFSVTVWLIRNDPESVGLDRILMSVNDDGWGFLFEADEILFTKTGGASVSGGSTWGDNDTLHMVGVTYDGANVKFYIDGTLVASPSFSETFNSSGGDYTIGSRGEAEYFTGYMTDLRVYDDVISDGDMATIFNSGVPDYGDGTTGATFFAWWKMDEGAGDVLGDSSGNDLDGEIFGAEWFPPAEDWIPMRLGHIKPRAAAPRRRPEGRLIGGLLQHIDQQTLDKIKPRLVPRDPRATSRTIRHEQVVSAILNSLLRNREIVQTSSERYTLGYHADDLQDWAPGEPTTVAAALDRLAALAKTLNGGIGA